MTYKHFKSEEIIGLDERLCIMLDMAREICGFPFRITSGLRTPEDNERVGGVPDSSHEKGLAVDLSAPSDIEPKYRMVWSLGLAGFKRVGVYTRHIHVDIDELKPQYVMWHGESH